MTLQLISKKLRWGRALMLLQAGFLATSAFAATSVSQFGITWTFDRDYPTGQFANGDYWVVGPVKITSITPRSTVSGGATLNGSMINPVVNGSQGYDSRIKNNPYSDALNVGRSFPLTVQPNSSLLSSISNAAAVSGDNPQLNTIAILTVLDRAAAAGSFRPPYIGSDKTLRWNKSQLNYGRLRALSPVNGAPTLAAMEPSFERPWIEQKTNWTGRYMHPSGNQPAYGRELAHVVGHGMLALQLNYTAAQKEKLAVRLVQYGIDIYGAARAGAVWNNDGGHNQGRKMPLLLAGAMLNDSSILAYADGTRSRIFQEDQQTWYVTQADVGRALYTGDGRPREKYIGADVGMAEWGEKHYTDPSRDGRNWSAYYRTVTGAPTAGHVLVARLMGLESKWNWPAIFDYYDRYWQMEKGGSGGGANSISSFVANMWSTYRNSTPGQYTEDNVATETWQNTAFSAQKGTFTVAFDMVASANNMDGVTGLSSGAASDYDHLAAAVRFAPSGHIDARNGGAFQATTALRYSAGVKYRIVMTVDVATKRYSVKITPAGGATQTIADSWQFRTQQASVAKLDNIGFKSEAGSHAVLDFGLDSAGSKPAPAPTPEPVPVPQPTPTPSEQVSTALANTSFENGLTSWSTSGNVSAIAANSMYKATNGSQVVVFNGGQSAPNGSISQTIATKAGTTYTVAFDAGVLAYNTKEQRLNVTATGTKTLLSATISIFGKSGGSIVWKPASYTFVADSSSTKLTFKDVSTVTDSLDLLLDNVRVTASSVSAPVETTPTTPAPTVALANGSFESGTTSWAATGNLDVVTANSMYKATSGSKVLVFNGGQAAPNGSVSQTIATKAGTTYKLVLDFGVLAYNTKEQRLNVTATGTKTLLSTTASAVGKGGGSTVWKTLTYTFVADSSSTKLTFKDVSTVTDSIDLLVDNVRVSL